MLSFFVPSHDRLLVNQQLSQFYNNYGMYCDWYNIGILTGSTDLALGISCRSWQRLMTPFSPLHVVIVVLRVTLEMRWKGQINVSWTCKECMAGSDS